MADMELVADCWQKEKDRALEIPMHNSNIFSICTDLKYFQYLNFLNKPLAWETVVIHFLHFGLGTQAVATGFSALFKNIYLS